MGKIIFDRLLAFTALIMLMPFFALIALMIRKDGGPAFFRQKRVGLKGRPFSIIKFRTMIPDAEKYGGQITSGHDPRITTVGGFLRKSKMDELPQLINVFLGQMSLVGPRPEVPYYVEKWSAEDRKILLSVRPGITDYASLYYSNEQEILACADDPEECYIQKIMPEKLRLYRKYAQNHNLWLDFRIIVATLLKLAGLNAAMILPEIRKMPVSAEDIQV
ncbi:MAG: sugar transferase [Desulfobacterales bacterium]|nr:MAG: sugar transferase [Desulfobacterales bacterium]